ncbi:MAG: hypothetical protein HOV79_19345 [Hamadaea sp.]|nr:hypothetical protein [Hamadaea sp.]
MLAARMAGNFGYGLLVIRDSKADFRDLPDFPRRNDANQPRFLSAEDATVVRIQHGSDGDVEVRLWIDDGEAWTRPHGVVGLGQTSLSLPSGRILLCDALQEKSVTATVTPGNYCLQIYADELANASAMDILLSTRP